jgi:hypothetical protein
VRWLQRRIELVRGSMSARQAAGLMASAQENRWILALGDVQAFGGR